MSWVVIENNRAVQVAGQYLSNARLEIDAGVVGDQLGSSIGRRLVEIGFVPGESVQIIEAVWPGGDPIAVRVGTTVFALRRREAQAVLVQVEKP